MARNPVVGRALVALVHLRRGKLAFCGPAQLGGCLRLGELRRDARRGRCSRISSGAGRSSSTAAGAASGGRAALGRAEAGGERAPRARHAPVSQPHAARRIPSRRVPRRRASARAARLGSAREARQPLPVPPPPRRRRLLPAPAGCAELRPRSASCRARCREERAYLAPAGRGTVVPFCLRRRGRALARTWPSERLANAALAATPAHGSAKEWVVTVVCGQAARGVAARRTNVAAHQL